MIDGELSFEAKKINVKEIHRSGGRGLGCKLIWSSSIHPFIRKISVKIIDN